MIQPGQGWGQLPLSPVATLMHLVTQIRRSLYSPSCPTCLGQTPASIAKTIRPILYTNSPKPHPLLSLHSSFIPNSKHCSSTNPFLICPLLPTSSPVSTLNTIHHSRLAVCVYLSDPLDLTRCLSILFWTSVCE